MGAVDLLPCPEGRSPTPTMPATVSTAPVDPRYGGLSAREIEDIDRMRQAINEHPNGKDAKPKTLIAAVQISNQRGRKALRWLAQYEAYQGHARPLKQSPSSSQGEQL
jgi:hypothetical protein